MLLYTSSTSPFARKVRVVIRERSLTSRINEFSVQPYTDPPTLLLANPMGQVPTLVLDDGQVLLDSTVICAYLDAQGDASPLIPSTGRERWRALTHAALADGVMEQAMIGVMEKRRPASQQNADVVTRAFAKIERSLSALQRYALEAMPWNLAHIGLASALGYLDFRHPDYLWRPAHPALAQWSTQAFARPAHSATELFDSTKNTETSAKYG